MTKNNNSGNMKKLMKNKWIRGTAIGAATIATGYGTFTSREGDFPPFYVNKTGASGGLAIGLRVDIDKDAEFYGVVASPWTNIKGTLNGINLNAFDGQSRGIINGLEVGLIDIPPFTGEGTDMKWDVQKDLNGVDIGFMNFADKVNGFRLGLANIAQGGDGLDIGIINGYDENPNDSEQNRYFGGLIDYHAEGKNINN